MNKINQILIYGKSDFAKLMRVYLDRECDKKVVAYVADQSFINNCKTFDSLPLVPFENVEELYPVDSYKMLTAVGYSNMRARKLIYNKAKSKGYDFINYIAPTALVDDNVSIGNNNVILHDCVIEPNVKIGDNNIIWSSVNVSHDAVLASHSFIASQSLIGGYTKINDGCFLGFNSTCVQRINIATESLIGAKSLVLKDTLSYSKNVGAPAQLSGFHEKEGIRIR